MIQNATVIHIKWLEPQSPETVEGVMIQLIKRGVFPPVSSMNIMVDRKNLKIKKDGRLEQNNMEILLSWMKPQDPFEIEEKFRKMVDEGKFGFVGECRCMIDYRKIKYKDSKFYVDRPIMLDSKSKLNKYERMVTDMGVELDRRM